MYDLSSYSFTKAMRHSSILRRLGDGIETTSVEMVAQRVSRFVHKTVRHDGEPAFALVRMYQTLPFKQLPTGLQNFAKGARMLAPLEDHTRCIALLGSEGFLEEWRGRRSSQTRRAVPLTSLEIIKTVPVVASMCFELGLGGGTPPADIKNSVVFHVRQHQSVIYVLNVEESPILTNQRHLLELNIKTVIGMASDLGNGEVFAMMMFGVCHFEQDPTPHFETMLPAIKVAMTSRLQHSVFERGPAIRQSG